MNTDDATRLIATYIEGWKQADRAKILGALDPTCVVIESYGPVYRGVERVGQWIDAWFGEGNTVDAWEITSLSVGDGAASVEWRFSCTWRGAPSTFEGASIVRFSAGKILYLREYQTSAPLYEWEGAWRP